MTSKQADTVKQLLAVFEKGYGKPGLLPDLPPRDQVVYLLIESVAGKKAAEAGLARLRKTYADWNEVRVSSHREIEAGLNEVAKEDRLTAAMRIKAGLEHLFEAECREEFVLGCHAEDPDDDLHFLSGVEGLDHGRAGLVLHTTRPDDVPFIAFAAVGRILTRVGVMKKTTSAKAVRAAVVELVEAKDLPRLTYLLTRHGHEVCGVKSYYCTSCAAASICTMGKRRVRGRRAAPKAGKKTGGRKTAARGKSRKKAARK